MGIIQSRAIWATNIEYLNDAKEFSYSRDLAEDVIRQLPEQGESEGNSRLKLCFLEGIREPRESRVFVTSFSEFGDRLSQWRGYGAQIGGYALGFTLDSLSAIEKRNPFSNWATIMVTPCWYIEQEQRQLIVEWYQHMPGVLQSIWKGQVAKKHPITDERLAELASMMLDWVAPVFKHPAFVEETEWRLVIDLKHVQQPVISVRAGQTTLIPYVSVPLTNSDEPLQFAKVIVGPTPLAELAKRALSYVFNEQHPTAREILNSSSPLRAL